MKAPSALSNANSNVNNGGASKTGGSGKGKGGRTGGANVRVSVSGATGGTSSGAADSDKQERVPLKRMFVVSASTDHRCALTEMMSGGLVGVFHSAKNSDDVSHMWDLEEPATWKANAKKKKSHAAAQNKTG